MQFRAAGYPAGRMRARYASEMAFLPWIAACLCCRGDRGDCRPSCIRPTRSSGRRGASRTKWRRFAAWRSSPRSSPVRPSRRGGARVHRREIAKAPKMEHYWDVDENGGRCIAVPTSSPRENLRPTRWISRPAPTTPTPHFLPVPQIWPRWNSAVIFAHELYHGFQDQHFDLKTYLLDVALEPGANADLVQARQRRGRRRGDLRRYYLPGSAWRGSAVRRASRSPRSSPPGRLESGQVGGGARGSVARRQRCARNCSRPSRRASDCQASCSKLSWVPTSMA